MLCDPDMVRVLSIALDAIVRSRCSLVCVDFGGTLLDFVPLHVSSFMKALGIAPENKDANVVRQTVERGAALGVDSFEMMKMVADAVRLPAEVDVDALVVSKRAFVERHLTNVALDPRICDFLVRVKASAAVAIISLGLVSSMETVVLRSLRSKASGIAIYGRHTLEERVSKPALLRRALVAFRVSSDSTAYLGDAEVDERIAKEMGLVFIRLAPFATK